MNYTPEDYAAARKMTTSGCPVLHTVVKMPRGYRRAEKPREFGVSLCCPFCRAIGDTDDYGVMGLPEGTAQCLTCGRLVVPIDVVEVSEPMPLFDGRKS